jgi:hypothetical protein
LVTGGWAKRSVPTIPLITHGITLRIGGGHGASAFAHPTRCDIKIITMMAYVGSAGHVKLEHCFGHFAAMTKQA